MTIKFNKVPVKHRLGHASGNQSDAAHLLNQSGGAGDDCQVYISVNLWIYLELELFSDTKKLTDWLSPRFVMSSFFNQDSCDI